MAVKIKYNNNFQTLVEATNIVSFCAEITFINQGLVNAYVNGAVKLVPGASIAFDGKKDEEDTTLYRVTFDTGAGADLVVVRKYYNA